MEIGLLIKDYSDCKAKLLSSLSYLIDDISNFNDTFSDTFMGDFEFMFNIMSRIYNDIKFVDENIELLRKIEVLEEKGV